MIGVLTYNIPHRKTYDTLCLLKAKGYKEVIVYAKEFHYKKTFFPLYNHRPICSNKISPKQLCKNFNYRYIEHSITEDTLPYNSKVMVCGSGIIHRSIVKNYKIINSHPGYIPNVRGLDALKWAIFEKQPIGVTTHKIGAYIDAGLIIERNIVPFYERDTFHSLAQRQYEMEIDMLVRGIEKIDVATEVIVPENFVIHKRMPKDKEMILMEKFEELKSEITRQKKYD